MNYDLSYQIYFVGEWSNWDEGVSVFVFLRDGKFYSAETGHILGQEMQLKTPNFKDVIYQITEKEVDEILMEWIDMDCTNDYLLY